MLNHSTVQDKAHTEFSGESFGPAAMPVDELLLKNDFRIQIDI